MEMKLVDPKDGLLPELFAHSLSFLPPTSIASSNAVDKSWRNIILANPILHQEIDLLRLGEGSNIDQVIDHFARLSALALQKLVKVSLNLSCFWDDFEENHKGKGPASTGLSLLFQILLNSNETIRELNIEIDVTTFEDSSPLLLILLKQLPLFTNLRKIEIEAPFPMYLKARGQVEESRSLEITNNHSRRLLSEDLSQLPTLLEHVHEISGEGFTEVWFCAPPYPGSQASSSLDQPQFLNKLSVSATTIRILDLSYFRMDFGRPIWDFSIRSCPNLISLTLNLMPIDFPEGGEAVMDNLQLEIPEGISLVEGLNVLDLEVIAYEIPWTSMERWIGSQLEEFSLITRPTPGVEETRILSSALRSILVNSRQTLRAAQLDHVSIHQTPEDDTVEEFPNLKVLNLSGICPSVCKFFSTVSAPNLRDLSFKFSKSWDHSEVQVTFNSLLWLLSSCQNNLLRLTFSSQGSELRNMLSANLSFIHLETLVLNPNHESVVNWFSRFNYPSLKHPFPRKSTSAYSEYFDESDSDDSDAYRS